MEKNAGKGDTPGMKNRISAEIVHDIRGFKRLELPRHRINKRQANVNQTLLLLAHSWRANCDLQLLIYDGDPENPNPKEIACVTDYIVAYACKGVESLQEEKEQTKSLVLAAREISGCERDVQHVTRQILNRSIGKK